MCAATAMGHFQRCTSKSPHSNLASGLPLQNPDVIYQLHLSSSRGVLTGLVTETGSHENIVSNLAPHAASYPFWACVWGRVCVCFRRCALESYKVPVNASELSHIKTVMTGSTVLLQWTGVRSASLSTPDVMSSVGRWGHPGSDQDWAPDPAPPFQGAAGQPQDRGEKTPAFSQPLVSEVK